jgi:acylphosphatase
MTDLWVERTGVRRYTGRSTRGAEVLIGSEDVDGVFTPGELLKIALAACSGMSSDHSLRSRLGDDYEAPRHRRAFDRQGVHRWPHLEDGHGGHLRGHREVTGQAGDGVDGRVDEQVRLSAWVHGRVQGVGFRWWTRARALEIGLTGFAANTDDGRVHVVARGPRASCQRLLDLLQSGTTPGRVDTVVHDWSGPGDPIEGFAER